MKTKDVFSLAVRLLGLVFLYRGLLALPKAIGVIIIFFLSVSGLTRTLAVDIDLFVESVVMAGWPLLLAWWLLRGARLVMRIAFPDAVSSLKDDAQMAGVPGQKAGA